MAEDDEQMERVAHALRNRQIAFGLTVPKDWRYQVELARAALLAAGSGSPEEEYRRGYRQACEDVTHFNGHYAASGSLTRERRALEQIVERIKVMTVPTITTSEILDLARDALSSGSDPE